MLSDQPPPVVVESIEARETQEKELQKAEALIASGAIAEAQNQLLGLERAGYQASQIQFLLGLISLSQKNFEDAISRFRKILAREPNAVRVRLELGRTYFQKGDLRNAERQFQFARSGKLPASVLKNVDTYLANIRRNRTFEIGLSLALAPDSNINAGPSLGNILIFGLPFQLSPDATANSGVGFAVATRANWSPRISHQLRWDFGVVAEGRRYGRSEFNDTAIAISSGPHLILEKSDARLNVRGTRRWYGGNVFANGLGANLELTYYFSGRTGVFSNLGVTRLRYPNLAVQNGVVSEYSIGAFHALTPSSIGRLSLLVGRQSAQAPALANRIAGAEVNYLKETGNGFTFNLLGRYRQSNYDEKLPGFPVIRRDRQFVSQLTVLNRRIVAGVFTPTVSITYTHNLSNLPLFRFRRTQFEFGLTRTF